MEARPDRSLGNPQHFGNGGVPQALDGEEREDGSLIVGKERHRLSEAFVRYLVSMARGRQRFESAGAVQFPALPPRPLFKGDMKGDFHEPSQQAPLAPVAREAPVNQDEGILRDIRGLGRVLGQPEPERRDFRPVSAKEPVEGGFAVSSRQERRDLRIFNIGSLGFHSYEECQGTKNLQ